MKTILDTLLRQPLGVCVGFTVAIGLVGLAWRVKTLRGERWWDQAVQASVDRAPERRQAWEEFLRGVPQAERKAIGYLVADLPLRDLEGLPTWELLDNAELANRAVREVPWGKDVPEDVLLDSVVPHESAGERDGGMRKVFFDRYISATREFKRPGEMAIYLNRRLFKDFGVSYSASGYTGATDVDKIVAAGKVNCVGLSLLLIAACRAVGVPARIATIQSWPDGPGGHVWVEVWDRGWHFTGASEPYDGGLDLAFFVDHARKAKANDPNHAIFAVSYRASGDHVPGTFLNAVNVTERYVRIPAR